MAKRSAAMLLREHGMPALAWGEPRHAARNAKRPGDCGCSASAAARGQAGKGPPQPDLV